MSKPKCLRDYCWSPVACGAWGYCRQRNVDAGGMKNVSPDDQKLWKSLDSKDPQS
jgi:hypothetical protein